MLFALSLTKMQDHFINLSNIKELNGGKTLKFSFQVTARIL